MESQLRRAADGLAKMIDALDAVNDANYKAAEIRRQISEREQQGALKSIEISKRASDALDSFAQKPQFATDNLKKARSSFNEKASAIRGAELPGFSLAEIQSTSEDSRRFANDQANGRIIEFARDAAEQGAQDNAVVLQRDAAGVPLSAIGASTPGITNVGDPEQRRAQAKAASENITKLTSVFDAIKADPASTATAADQKALLTEIQNQTAILDNVNVADIQGSDMAAGVGNLAGDLQESITAENAMLDVLKLMRDDTTLIAAAQEDLKSLQRLQLSGEQLAKSDLQELGKIQRETDPGKKAALIQERQDRKGNTALRKIQSGEELDLTDMANLLNNLDELGSTDFALQNPAKFQEFVNQAKREGGQAAEAGRGQLGEPKRKIQTGLAGKDLTQTPQAEALRTIEAEQQAANDALVTDSVTKVEKAAVAMLAAAKEAYEQVEASVARANALRGTDANVPATEAPIALPVPGGSRFREGRAEDQALNPVPVAAMGDMALPNRIATGNVRPNVSPNGRRPFQSTLQFDENAKPTGGMKVPEDIEIAATIGDFQINLMGTENAIGQLQNAVVSVALEQIQQQLPALIEEQQAKIKGQV